MNMPLIDIQVYVTDDGKRPFDTWMETLTSQEKTIIRRRIARLRLGNYGDAKTLKGYRGLRELRIHEGPGYRVYFGKYKDTMVIVLCGGKKRTQSRDILKAKKYWEDYLKNDKEKNG